MRKKIIAGNYKMNKTVTEVIDFLKQIKNDINIEEKEVVVCPNNLAVALAVKELEGTNIKVGVQNIYFENNGAYTGETSAKMAKDSGAKYVICGHSERRTIFNETDLDVEKKVIKCLENDLIPIICVGENLTQRENNFHFVTVKHQVINATRNIAKEDIEKIVIAYEPIWAIGTGVTASKEQAEEMCKYIREKLKEIYSEEIADKVRILYGGSVTAETSDTLLNMPNIDGALIGSASLKTEFIDIVNTKI